MSGLKYSPDYFGLAQYLLDGLQDAYNPTHCSGSITAALQLISTKTLDTTNQEERRREAALLKVLYRFITVKRPKHQLKKWMERFSTCVDCKESGYYGNPANAPSLTMYLHASWQVVKPRLTAYYRWLCSTVGRLDRDAMYPIDSCFAVVYAMQLINGMMDCEFKSVAQGTGKRWPKSIPHLVPYGPDQLVESVLQWYLIYPESGIFQLFVTLLSIIRSTVYPSLIKYRFIGVLADTTKRHLDIYFDVIDGSIQLDPTKRSTFFGNVKAMATLFLCFLGHTIHHDHLLPSIKMALSDGYEVKIVQLLSLLVSIYPNLESHISDRDIKDDPILPQLLKYSYSIYWDFNMHTSSSPASKMLLALPIVEHSNNIFFGTYEGFEAELGLSLIWSTGVMYGCSAKVYGCNQYFENVGRDLKFCDRCLGVYYCGKECQAQDWNDGEYPHKRICPALSKIVRVQCAQLEETSDDFVPSLNYVLQHAVRGNSDLEKVVAIRKIIRMGDLSSEEASILRGWGRRIYVTHKMEEHEWQPGYPDYDAILERLMKPSKNRKAAQFAPMSKLPSEQIVKQKAQLLSTA
ncbi:hypothetical protein BJ165DRAFT_1521462 [Panaeolus papilionaceus]|nr:hypothetical protein BJ165DRAFT_1521462 [Panaeolus papilionaceus]